jgi:DNA-binding NarL/FixJ family response regulator
MLQEFELFFHYVFNSSRDGISILDLDLNILGVNYTMERWYAHKKPFVGRKCYQVYHESDVPCSRCPTKTAIATGKSHVGIVPYENSGEVRGRQELSVFPLFDDNNILFGAIEYVRDITRQQEEEETLENLKKRLQFQDKTMQEQEIALKVLLRQGEKEEEKLSASIISNMNTLVRPLLDKLGEELEGKEGSDTLSLLEERLEQITSPFIRKLSLNNCGFTPRELEIASHIRAGWSSKQIARFLNISVKAVEFHRINIREKLGILNSKENLYSFLVSME